ncbi:hypothetical protein [Spirosoma pollinicola]|uniref:Curlin n=1 Tax=Spirosoma pollinicola TaxID=2057025 RepID=A0A2K8Z5N2_9BACT|nr:hypothetical protein [Spirosoma pollinicola]AUD05185.1 hypothetical protein CWM47_27075 [Spirosoma pollinicola]
MKKAFFLSLATLSSAVAVAQNTAVINQQGSSHDVSVVQQGTGNTSVISQANSGSSNSVVISQSGAGNVATINQGSLPDGYAEPKNSVTTVQTGEGVTIVNQSKGSNTISVYQSGMPETTKKKKKQKGHFNN